jgi:hypothetical protein
VTSAHRAAAYTLMMFGSIVRVAGRSAWPLSRRYCRRLNGRPRMTDFSYARGRLVLAGATAFVLVLGCRSTRDDQPARRLTEGAKVRFVTSPESTWQQGEVGTMGDCLTVLRAVPQPPEEARRYVPVAIASIRELQVDAGSLDRLGQGSAAGASAEARAGTPRWEPVPVASVRRAPGWCEG